ncbi:hypothetical protein ABEV17_02905, partial [Anoxybacillus kestanbolensis]
MVHEKLAPYVERITTDRYGNLLAQKKCKTGCGPTILLNAHLDTVAELEAGREIVKNGPIWSSSKGILGADDRAGVAVLLKANSAWHCSRGRAISSLKINEVFW